MHSQKLLENQRELLKSLLSLNGKSAGKLSLDAGINRSTMINAVAGIRPISGDSLNALITCLGLTKSWTLEPSKLHYWKVGAATGDLTLAINNLVKLPSIWPLSQFISDKTDEAYTGFFLICGRSELFKHGHPTMPYIVINRDKFRLGKGVEAKVAPENALPISPDLFKNAEWGRVSVKIWPPTQYDFIKSKIEQNLSIDYVNRLIEHQPTSWDSAIESAMSLGLSPDDLLAVINDLKKPRD